MGMGGGGAGGAITAHVHDNNAGQGGPLSDLSLLNTDLIIDLHKYELLHNYEASVAEATHTFTPASALDFDTYSEIRVIFDGITTASLALELIVNGERGINDYIGTGKRFAITPTETLISENAPQWTLATTTMLSGVNNAFFGEITLGANSTGGANDLLINSRFNTVGISEEKTGGNQTDTIDEITSILIETSTSTWVIGTKMTVYGIKR